MPLTRSIVTLVISLSLVGCDFFNLGQTPVPETVNEVIVVGIGRPGFSGDGGPASKAELSSPSGIATDSMGNLYIADSNNNRIRKVDAKTKIITTVAGSGMRGFSGDSTEANGAGLNSPNDVTIDSNGNLYISDRQNNRIRKVDAETKNHYNCSWYRLLWRCCLFGRRRSSHRC